ncbi:MAG: hypothetical protein KAJ20_00955 [Candidatus Aenigmarchaeota archaeon]|nr:hypothetical protein [Candidatus Aenigmarchaeota archaeon]MCK5063005.1 hypothetical protein [Candidatus Aenigmarchaeota archaeon]MCK5289560.1 hypothetical protein [Candidatus Aenigmarchaeota archaeon]MCK5372885.1 hypothetical protein [Candidatus Aenigmarchaeota archaeon]MCK5452008.1 hypothetical protein [Candidatus Aenigmarchaeota archaeon]
MDAYISLTPIGLFAHDKNGSQLDSIIFSDRKKSKDAFIKAMGRKVTAEEKDLIKKIGTKADIIFEQSKEGYRDEFPNISGNIVRENLPKLAVSVGFCKNASEYYSYLHELNTSMTRDAIKAAATEDRLVIHAINTADELESTANTLSIRLKEWYALYYPELVEDVRSNEKLASMIAQNAIRNDTSENNTQKSMGGDYSESDVSEMQRFAAMIDKMYSHRKALEAYIKEKSGQIMPNACLLISPMLAARILADAGSLEKISKMPSSRIQVMGAEKALFRHMQGQGPSPKHGLIFQSPLVNQAQKKIRGKISRILASKLSIAFKMDYFDKKLTGGNKLKEDLDKRLNNLKG